MGNRRRTDKIFLFYFFPATGGEKIKQSNKTENFIGEKTPGTGSQKLTIIGGISDERNAATYV